MSEVLYSAGEPGASSCSDEATGANEATSAALANGRGHLFNEIANHALSLRSLVGSALQSTDTHEQGALLDSAYSLAALIGYLADAAADAMRCSLVVGGADDWLLSPVARKALQTLRDRGAA